MLSPPVFKAKRTEFCSRAVLEDDDLITVGGHVHGDFLTSAIHTFPIHSFYCVRLFIYTMYSNQTTSPSKRTPSVSRITRKMNTKYKKPQTAGLKSLTYTERLFRLNLESLESRRVKADLVLLFKVIHGFVDIDYLSLIHI